MIRLPRTLAAWNSTRFGEILDGELRQLGAAGLPLQTALRYGSVALDEGIHAVVLSATPDEDGWLRIRAGLQYQGMIAGCACADDPTPEHPTLEYCTVLIEIDRRDAVARITLLDDGAP